MSSLHKSIILALGLSVSTTMAQADGIDTTSVYAQGEQPVVVAKKRDARQRGECGESPSPWALNICESNTFCYVDPKQLSLWLPDGKRPSGTVRAVIENSQTGATTELSWRSSATTLEWPVTKMPIYSDIAYFAVKLKKRRVSVFNKEIILYKIPVDRKTKGERADWMDKKGCTSQAEMLLEEQMG